jgi:hypothetical protein
LFTKTYARERERVCPRNEKLLTMVRNKLGVYKSGSTSVSTAPDRELQWEKEGYILFLICLVIGFDSSLHLTLMRSIAEVELVEDVYGSTCVDCAIAKLAC